MKLYFTKNRIGKIGSMAKFRLICLQCPGEREDLLDWKTSNGLLVHAKSNPSGDTFMHFWPMDCSPSGFSLMGSHRQENWSRVSFSAQGIFALETEPTSLCLLHCKQVLHHTYPHSSRRGWLVARRLLQVTGGSAHVMHIPHFKSEKFWSSV